MTDGELNPIVFSKNVIEFVTVANEYCKFIETAGSEDAWALLGKAQKLLPLIYLKASVIPEFESSEELSPEKFVTEVDYNFLQQRIMNLLGPYDDYQEVFDERMQFSERPVAASISENLADIYQDLKDFILAYRIGDDQVMQEALWTCMIDFRTHWGQQLVNGLRAIHALVYSDADLDQHLKLPPEEENSKPGWLNNLFNREIE